MSPEDMTTIENICVGRGIACISMIIIGVIYFTLAVYIDYKKCNKFRKPDLKKPNCTPPYLLPDEDVTEEERKIVSGEDRNDYLITAKNLFKTYPNGFPAVSNVTFGIK